jgi:hypothetical protein
MCHRALRNTFLPHSASEYPGRHPNTIPGQAVECSMSMSDTKIYDVVGMRIIIAWPVRLRS